MDNFCNLLINNDNNFVCFSKRLFRLTVFSSLFLYSVCGFLYCFWGGRLISPPDDAHVKRFWFSCILALALVALIAIGFMPTPARASSSTEPAPTAEKGSAPKETEGRDGSVYIHLQPMILPIVGDDGAEQIVTLLIDLQVKDYSVSEKIRQKMPRVQDTILRSLYGGLGDGSLRQGDQVDIVKIKGKIRAAIDASMGEKVIDDVLIQAVGQRTL